MDYFSLMFLAGPLLDQGAVLATVSIMMGWDREMHGAKGEKK